VGPRAGLDDVRRENSWPSGDLNSGPFVVQPVASRKTDYALPVFRGLEANLYAYLSKQLMEVHCQRHVFAVLLQGKSSQ
jgi:hypothetical protein